MIINRDRYWLYKNSNIIYMILYFYHVHIIIQFPITQLKRKCIRIYSVIVQFSERVNMSSKYSLFAISPAYLLMALSYRFPLALLSSWYRWIKYAIIDSPSWHCLMILRIPDGGREKRRLRRVHTHEHIVVNQKPVGIVGSMINVINRSMAHLFRL